MSEMVRIRVLVSTGFNGAEYEDFHEIEKEEWDGMNDLEQSSLLDELAVELRDNHIECFAHVVEGDDA